jgi:hypothetical protein
MTQSDTKPARLLTQRTYRSFHKLGDLCNRRLRFGVRSKLFDIRSCVRTRGSPLHFLSHHRS